MSCKRNKTKRTKQPDFIQEMARRVSVIRQIQLIEDPRIQNIVGMFWSATGKLPTLSELNEIIDQQNKMLEKICSEVSNEPTFKNETH